MILYDKYYIRIMDLPGAQNLSRFECSNFSLSDNLLVICPAVFAFDGLDVTGFG